MSGILEVLGAISAALSVLKAARGVADWIDEYDEFDDDVDRAVDVVGLLTFRWTRLTQYLYEARQYGHDDGQLTVHANAVKRKLWEAYDLVKDLQNRDKTTNMKVLLGFGPRKLKKLKIKVDDTADHLQSIEIVFLGWSATDLRRIMSGSTSLPLSTSPTLSTSPDESPVGSPLSRTASGLDYNSDSDPLSDTFSRAPTLPVQAVTTLERRDTVRSPSPGVGKPKKPVSVILEKVLVRHGVEKLHLKDPNKVQVSGARVKNEPLLHCLIRRQMVDDILYLLREWRDVNVNILNAANRPPLHHAVNMVSEKTVPVVKALVEQGAKFSTDGRPRLKGQMAKAVSRLLDDFKL